MSLRVILLSGQIHINLADPYNKVCTKSSLNVYMFVLLALFYLLVYVNG